MATESTKDSAPPAPRRRLTPKLIQRVPRPVKPSITIPDSTASQHTSKRSSFQRARAEYVLQLTPEESSLIQLKLALAVGMRKQRQ